MKTILTLSLHLLIASFLLAQSPLGIPYQAVMRNADGTVMASSAVNLTFMIHDGTVIGNVVFQESHVLTSNAQGLVSCVVGNGVVSQGNFANINWGSGAKFLHVMMGTTDLGTQQLLSVPYALYSNGVNLSVSPTGDTLTIGNQTVIVPGISAANANNNTIPTSGLGAVVLPGNNTCADQFINVVGCNGQTSLTYDGRTYDLVEIGGQCWFADNLATDQYRNGDAIPTGLDNAAWSNTTSGAYSIYNNDPVNDSIYGKLYNWYTTVDSRGLCPTGWHVPTDCEWMYLEGSLGMTVEQQEFAYEYVLRGSNEGGMLKAILNWNYPNVGATNSSGFTALPGGSAAVGNFYSIGYQGFWWSSTEINSNSAWPRELARDESRVSRYVGSKQESFSIRCLKDSETPVIQGCTDGSACNFLANATQDDGSCLYPNATCDDGNVNTVNDVINGECVCGGAVIVNGCTNAQACNYNALANVDDGSCLIQGASCDDGNSSTNDDTISSTCQCSGIFNVPIGQDYLGGKLAYVFQPGDMGYIPGETHGLIAAPQDLPNALQLGCYGISISGADGSAIGSGQQNTIDALNCGGGPSMCSSLYLNGYDDWFLPSIGELAQLYANKDQIGGFDTGWGVYLSSTESNIYYVQIFRFSIGDAAVMAKNNIGYVRPVRMF